MAGAYAFFWQRQFEKLGHTVRIIAPQYVKPFVKQQKNDRNDAEAICTVMRQPNMKFVPTKSEEQQDIQALHRARTRLVNHRNHNMRRRRALLYLEILLRPRNMPDWTVARSIPQNFRNWR